MSNEINLLPFKRKNLYRYKKALQTTRIISVFLLLLLMVSSLIVFYFKSRLSIDSLKKEEENVLSNISRMRSKKARLALISDRLQSIEEIIDRRPDYEYRLGVILQNAPNDVSITELNITNNAISFNAQSNSLYSIGILMDNLVSMVTEKSVFSKVTLQYLSAGKSYSIAIKANLL